MECDDIIGIMLDCKYMGWTYQEYMRQPLQFLDTVRLFRIKEAEETERISKKYGSD